jgi:hypothetical protein
MLSKNFQTNHQLDIDLRTEFPCMIWHQDWAAQRVSKKRAIVIDQSVASMSRLRGSCKACAFFCAAVSKHAWEQR